jgi:hypothetical protein
VSRAVLCWSLGLLGAGMALFFPAPAREQIDNDLKLVAELKPDTYWTAGRYPNIQVKLVNTSTTAHRVIRPGAGCAEGFREPHVFYTATFRPPDGPPVQLESGKYNASEWWCVPFPLNTWAEDIIELRPGQGLLVSGHDWPPVFDFPGPGKATIRAHYVYTGGERPAARRAADPAGLKRMAGVPAFELVSNPIEVEVAAPLEVRLRVKQAVKVGRTYALGEVFEVTLVNRGMETVQIRPLKENRGDWLSIWFDRLDASPRRLACIFGAVKPMFRPAWGGEAGAITLRPGEAATVVGGTGQSDRPVDEKWANWTVPSVGTYRARAGYTPERWTPSNGCSLYYCTFASGSWDMAFFGTVKSNWVEIHVER